MSGRPQSAPDIAPGQQRCLEMTEGTRQFLDEGAFLLFIHTGQVEIMTIADGQTTIDIDMSAAVGKMGRPANVELSGH